MRPRHIPIRTCAGCREVRPKREMVRVVRDFSGTVAIDQTGKINGRGTYLCPKTECWEQALQTGSLARALKISIAPADRAGLDRAWEQLASTV
ncbi:MAG: YlxR family protein [Chloroflexi bacterium]|nr:YlxR family protein [Chloroflexota bacterium]